MQPLSLTLSDLIRSNLIALLHSHDLIWIDPIRSDLIWCDSPLSYYTAYEAFSLIIASYRYSFINTKIFVTKQISKLNLFFKLKITSEVWHSQGRSNISSSQLELKSFGDIDFLLVPQQRNQTCFALTAFRKKWCSLLPLPSRLFSKRCIFFFYVSSFSGSARSLPNFSPVSLS